MNPTIARLDAVVARLEQISRREQTLLRWLLVAVFVFVLSAVLSWGGFSWR
jgi:hypothetical protein